MTDVEALTLDYRAAFLRYLAQRSEAALAVGYELGRGAVVAGVSLLDLTSVHHRILAEVLADAPDEAPAVTAAAAEFLLEVLATFDMSHRRLRDAAPDSGGACR